jgi:ligand-binding SRPBCC domain-containing protein
LILKENNIETLHFTTEINAPQHAVWSFHDGTDALTKITPPRTKVWLPKTMPKMEAGARFILIVSQPPIFVPLPWETIIESYTKPSGFVDTQGRGPFAYWRHEHQFIDLGESRTQLVDIVSYKAPFGFIGGIANQLFIRKQLNALFAHRHKLTKQLLET